MPKDYEWLHWAKHKDLYGPISTVRVLKTRVIIISDLQTAIDLLDTKSSIYSNRPKFPFAGEMIGWNRQMILSQYDERFRLMRKYVKSFIGTRAAITAHKGVQEMETRYFLARVLEDPSSVIDQIRKSAGSTFLKLSHGYTVDTTRPDTLVELVENASKEFHTATLPGEWLIDSIPLMRFLPEWFPGEHFKKVGKVFREHNIEQANRPVDFVRRQMAAGIEVPSFTSQMLRKGLNEYEEDVVMWGANSLYGGGTDTTTAALTTFILIMVLYPEVQKKAQAEIDAIVGNDRLPEVDDRPKLPYLEAVLMEVLRYHPIGPMGIPHCVAQDDVYKGMFIPKDSIVLVNLWLIAHNPEIYPDPDRFDPERFYGENKQLDPQTFVYGFGRRACPGRELSNSNMFLLMSMFLSVFNITKAVDSKGNVIEPRHEFGSGTVSHAKPFDFSIKPRSAAAEAMVRNIFDEYPPPRSNAEDL
ncbi:cytochrome P450 oxidoreductase [Collybia nuda]|uniref:Cytochrome P450 oxidoreductase n=1 Tax=Collybia nuda TaxID=64659 RepID=A0A9P6CCX9_9AGAR|nr:cytochrome P450 oxidoreductase [Collybia nuda]